jgi:hypothetical protein
MELLHELPGLSQELGQFFKLAESPKKDRNFHRRSPTNSIIIPSSLG